MACVCVRATTASPLLSIRTLFPVPPGKPLAGQLADVCRPGTGGCWESPMTELPLTDAEVGTG